MSAQLQQIESTVVASTAVAVIDRASQALNKAETERELILLAQASKPIVAVTNYAGRAICHESLMDLRKMRVEIEKRGKKARAYATSFSKACVTIEDELIALIQPEENRLEALRDGWDKKVAAEKEANRLAEIARLAEIQRRIDGIRNWTVNAAGQSSLLVGQMLAQAQAHRIEPDVFQERAGEAGAVLAASTAALVVLLAQRKEHEAAQEQLRLDQIEAARQRAVDAQRQKDLDAERTKREAEAQAARDAETARQAEANRIERERMASEEAAAKVIRDAESLRLANERTENERIARERQEGLDRQAEAQRVANAAEAQRLADQAADLARQQEELRKAQEPKPAPPAAEPTGKSRPVMVKTPHRDELVGVIAAHYGVDPGIANYWLSSIRWSEAA